MALQQLLRVTVPKIKISSRGGNYIIVDFRDEYIRLPNGLVIPKDRIVHIDTERKVILFLDEKNMLREARYG